MGRKWMPSRGTVIGGAVFVAACLAFRLARWGLGVWSVDDAAITYAAAFELADHGTLGAHVEGMPVEGYSNPLVFFVTALLRLVGLFDAITTHVHVEMALFGGMVVLVWSLFRHVAAWVGVVAAVTFATLELLTPATWLWYGSGLENVWLAAGVVMLVWICARTWRGVPLHPAWGLAIGLVALIRPEAPLYVATGYGALWIVAKPRDLAFLVHTRKLALALAATLAVYGAFLCWRRIGYGDWWPNTYYAKLHQGTNLGYQLKAYVIPKVLPYGASAWLALSAVALLVTAHSRRLGITLIAFALAALALPMIAGEDWMGEHRFATTFLCVAHLAFTALLATGTALACRVLVPVAAWQRGVAILALAPAIRFAMIDRHAPLDAASVLDVTTVKVAHLHGAQRWEQQARLGIPYAVYVGPDAGGTLLVGGTQYVDNAALTDFHMARIGPYYGDPVVLAQINAYQHGERHADLASPQDSGAIDHAVLARDYMPGDGPFHVRRDLVEVGALDAVLPLLAESPAAKIYLSPETVTTAAPRALLRCEVIVVWTQQSPGVMLRGSLGDDRDELALRPGPHRIERHALLVGAPTEPGTYQMSIELWTGDVGVNGASVAITVSADDTTLARAAAALVRDGSPPVAVTRIAQLREQMIPRFPMRRYRRITDNMREYDRRHMREAGLSLRWLRWNARLATTETLPAAIRVAERAAIARLIGACGVWHRTLCLGRAIDTLRRFGYLGVLDQLRDVAAELATAERAVAGAPLGARYELLVGLTLARPTRIDLQRALWHARHELAESGTSLALR